MSNDPRVLVLEEMRKQTALLSKILEALQLRSERARQIADELRGQTEKSVPDSLLDGPYGDPVVRAKSPRDWTGEEMIGRHFSECPPEYLDLLAERSDYFASKETDQKKAGYAVKDAQRARGWAARLRAGWKPAEPVRQEGEPTW